MKYLCGVFIGIAVMTGPLAAATSDVTVSAQSNYNSWGPGWDSVYVIKNGIITLAAVPKIGGRIMQYDLGTHASMYVDSANKGKVPAVSALLGGFRTVASPQSGFPWPPSPVLEVAPYACSIKTNNPDSCVIYLESRIENTAEYPTLAGLQFKRTITVHKSSSHVKVMMTMVNKGAQTLPSHGIWDITERICRNNNLLDTTNIWLYFPLNPASSMGSGKGYVQLQGTDTTQWKRNVAAGGIMGVHYRRKDGKIGADSKAGWVCYVDRLDGYAYATRFTYEEGKNYPDSGSSVEIYTSGSTTFLEEEVMGPLAALAPNDSLRMVEDWYAARSKGPVLAVNDAGLITKKLTIQQSNDTVRAQGVYGIFFQGTVKSVFKTAAGTTVAVADSQAVSPLDSFTFNAALKVPANAAKLILVSYGMSGAFIGNLDSISMQPATISSRGAILRDDYNLQETAFYAQGKHLSIQTALRGNYSITLTDLGGKCVERGRGELNGRAVISLSTIPSGVYIVKMKLLGRRGDPTGAIERRVVVLQ